MTALTVARPGPVWGDRPERHATGPDTAPLLQWHHGRELRGMRSPATLWAVGARRDNLASLSEAELRRFQQELTGRIMLEGLTGQQRHDAFALIVLTMRRTLGIDLYPEQVVAAWLLLEGTITEMQTGEGKTLAAMAGAFVAALAGTPVHVITANDYLVSRDAEQARLVAASLGLSIGCVRGADDENTRRSAYACDITYVTNKQVVFDYLRDRQRDPNTPGSLRSRLGGLVSGAEMQPLMRGLCFAIVDEADSVLIDDARTPLVLSQPQRPAIPSTNCAVALGLARRLAEQRDFNVDLAQRKIALTEPGRERIREMTQSLRGNWASIRYREELVTQALAGLQLYQRDQHYLVSAGNIVLIDETTGRPAPERKISHGVHQMIEIKEGCASSGHFETISSISTQRFFRRYHHLAGMTGTATEVARELSDVFGLPVVRIPLHRPSRRQTLDMQLVPSMAAKHDLLLSRIIAEHDRGRPVLIGTRTVAESEKISELLQTRGISHRVLSASQDRDEAEIVAQAGMAGSIVVATNMAGRGTDIPLGPGVPELGGLHVIWTQLNDSRRIDRQLVGRCARQGDPGSSELIISLEEDLLRELYPERMRRLLAAVSTSHPRLWQKLSPWLARLPQWRKERQHRRLRMNVLRKDEELEQLLAFSGIGR